MPLDEPKALRVWDLPTRAFHWLLALLFVALVVSGRIGGPWMVWHARAGYAVAALLLFRFTWGFVGGHWSRFASFAPSPRALAEHLRGRGSVAIGHSPLGALSVYAMLLFLAAQVGTGLFSDDQADFAGPFNILVANRTARLLSSYHKGIGQPVLIGLALLHVAAIAYYQRRRRRNLVGPMWHGDTLARAGARASRDDRRSRMLALAVMAACAAAVAAAVGLGGS